MVQLTFSPLNSDKMYTWGVGEQGQLGHKILPRHTVSGSLIPRMINFRPRGYGRMSNRFTRAYCGGYSTYLVHESNAVFAYGLNNYGQLGVEDSAPEVTEPLRVIGWEEANGLAEIRGGEHHSLL